MQYSKNNQTITYVVSYSTKKRIYFRVKDGIVKVSCPKRTTDKFIKELLDKYFLELTQKINNSQKQNVIHFNGISYKPKFFVGEKNGVMINGDEIWILSKKDDLDSYKKVLYDFYKIEIENELTNIIFKAKNDFSEIKKFPEIKLRYMKSMFGNYNRKTNIVKLSTILGKYDFKYIKYVLYHELSHVFEMNHSKKFYAVFDMKFPDLKMVKAQFKKIKYYDYL